MTKGPPGNGAKLTVFIVLLSRLGDTLNSSVRLLKTTLWFAFNEMVHLKLPIILHPGVTPLRG